MALVGLPTVEFNAMEQVINTKKESASKSISALQEDGETYMRGFREGYSQAMLQFQNILAVAQNPKIIVTTEENLEKIKKEYIK